MRLILASKSPRRQQLVKTLGLPFRVMSADMDESISPALSPEQIVRTLALRKAEHACSYFHKEIADDEIILSADTVVVLDDNTILNKPTSSAEACSMLSRLQDNSHFVFTGFTLKSHTACVTDFEKTKVFFNHMTRLEIETYLQEARPLDKAGAYGIQDESLAPFITRIEGCYNNVVGLPVAKIYKTLTLFSK